MRATFLRSIWPLLPRHARRRLLVGAAGAAVVAALDAVGVTLILPLARLITSLGDDRLPPELDSLGRITGITSPGTLAMVLAVATVSCFVVKGVLALVLLRSTLRTSLDAEASIAARLLRGYLGAPLEFHLQHNTAELQRTIQESTRRVYQEALVTAVPALGDQLILLTVSLVLLVVAPVEALVGGIFLLVLVGFYRRLTARRAAASSDELLEQTRRSIQYVQQALATVREIQIAGREDQFAAELLAVRERVAARQRTLTLTELLPRYYLEIGIVLGAGLVGAVAFYRHPADDAVALLALFLAAALRLLPSLNRVLVAEAKARVARPNLTRITEDLRELEQQDLEQDRVDRSPLPDGDGFERLDLDHVSVTYAGRDLPALTGATLTVERGDRIVFVGRSGSGKTTALNAALGFLEASDGEIRVNTIPISDCRRSWRQKISYVPQDVSILDASLSANVALGVPADEVDREKVASVLSAAELDDVVRDLPGGLDGHVGEGGGRLSGGQRQRLGLARALYQDPEVLVLDEATSALDARTEAQILDLLDALGPSVTILAVAHRQQAIRRFQRIAVFDAGRLVADGTWAELERTTPTFDDIVQEVDREVEEPGR